MGPESDPATLQRLRGRDDAPHGFRGRDAWPWLTGGGSVFIAVALLTIVWDDGGRVLERIASLAALFFFIAAMGAWLHMGRRTLPVAAALVVLFYGLSALTSLIDLHDLFLVSLLVGLALFALGGFNLIFVLEEIVYDAHRMMRLASPWWGIVPIAVVTAFIVLLPLIESWTGVRLRTVWVIAVAGLLVLAASWLTRAITDMGPRLTRETDLLVAGALAGGVLADAVGWLRQTTGILPTVIAYAAIVGTWIYISFTTLQRAQYFLPARDVVPWVALLLSSSFAVLAHVHAQYRTSGALAFPDLVGVRVGYMLFGVWVGLAFFILRGAWRISIYLRDTRRLSERTRTAAGRLARITEEALGTEHRLGDAAYRVMGGVERALPGPRSPPRRPGYPGLDEREGAPVEIERRRREAEGRGRGRRRP